MATSSEIHAAQVRWAYLLRGMLPRIDREKMGRDRMRTLSAEMADSMRALAVACRTTMEFVTRFADRFHVALGESVAAGPEGEKSVRGACAVIPLALAGDLPGREWEGKLIATWAMTARHIAFEALRVAVFEGPAFFVTFAQSRASEHDKDYFRPAEEVTGRRWAGVLPGEDMQSPRQHRAWFQVVSPFAHGHDEKAGNVVLFRRQVQIDPWTGGQSMVALSGGKDSTALTHLLRVGLGADVVAVSEKDDLDYPGEEEYVTGLAAAWGLRLEVVRPPVSPTTWLLERRGTLSAGEDMHSRSAALSKACFYGVMERANEAHDLLLWGLRAEESGRRRALLTKKGHTYRLKNGRWRSAPLASWSGADVYAYLQANGIDPLPVYRCCGWLPEHRAKPWLIRKSWWIPGAHAQHGQVAWLARYWPSLHAKLAAMTYDVRSYG